MKLIFGITIGLFLGHLLYSLVVHGSVNYTQAFERIWFQFGALVVYWFLSEKL